jgi:hypothetical protein
MVLPESSSVVCWSSAKVYNQRQNDQSNDSDNLDAGKYELSFSKHSHSTEVDHEDQEDDDGDPYGGLNKVTISPQLVQTVEIKTIELTEILSFQTSMTTAAAEISAQTVMAQLYH